MPPKSSAAKSPATAKSKWAAQTANCCSRTDAAEVAEAAEAAPTALEAPAAKGAEATPTAEKQNFVHGISIPCTNFLHPNQLRAQNTPSVHKLSPPQTNFPRHKNPAGKPRQKYPPEEPINLPGPYCRCKKKHYLCKI